MARVYKLYLYTVSTCNVVSGIWFMFYSNIENGDKRTQRKCARPNICLVNLLVYARRPVVTLIGVYCLSTSLSYSSHCDMGKSSLCV